MQTDSNPSRLLSELLHSLRTSLTILKHQNLPVNASEEVDYMSRNIKIVQWLSGPRTVKADEVKLSEVLKEVKTNDRCIVELTEISTVSDGKLIRVAVSEIIDNALKFSESEVFVSVHKTDPYLTIRIEDTGPGIPTADSKNVTEPFFRLDRDRVLARAGSGLGLAYAADIASVLGGKLSFISSDSGTTFFFQFRNHAEQ